MNGLKEGIASSTQAVTRLSGLCLLGAALILGAPQAAAQQLKEVKLITIAGAQMAPLYLAEERGYFAKEGIKLDIILGQDAAVYMPGVLAGEYGIAGLNGVALFNAREKGLPIQIFASGSSGGSNPKSHLSGFLVKGDSPYKSPKDLEGKTIAVAAIRSLPDIVAKAALEQDGADIRKVKFVEVPFPQMVGAVVDGRVDAAWNLEPFVTVGFNSGLRHIGGSYASVIKDMPVALWGGNANWLQQNRDAAAAFNRAIRVANEYATDNPGDARAILTKRLKIPAAVAEKIEMPSFPAEISKEAIQALSELARKYGVIEKPFDLQSAYFQP